MQQDGTVDAIWDLMGVRDPETLRKLERAADVHNVYKGGKPVRYNRHVTGARSPRDGMRALVRNMSDAYAAIQRVRERIGYPKVGLEVPAVGAEAPA